MGILSSLVLASVAGSEEMDDASLLQHIVKHDRGQLHDTYRGQTTTTTKPWVGGGNIDHPSCCQGKRVSSKGFSSQFSGVDCVQGRVSHQRRRRHKNPSWYCPETCPPTTTTTTWVGGGNIDHPSCCRIFVHDNFNCISSKWSYFSCLGGETKKPSWYCPETCR